MWNCYNTFLHNVWNKTFALSSTNISYQSKGREIIISYVSFANGLDEYISKLQHHGVYATGNQYSGVNTIAMLRHIYWDWIVRLLYDFYMCSFTDCVKGIQLSSVVNNTVSCL